jgi:glutamine amidotransferase
MADGVVRVLDYGAGNLRSVRRALERAGARVEVSSQVGGAGGDERLVIPGVGAFGEARRRLEPVWNDLVLWVRADKPTLGICLGMQLLFERSHEHGVHDGLGVFAGDVVAIPVRDGVTVPHMGWQRLRGEGDPSVYFAHSFAARKGAHCTAVVDHGEEWAAVVRKGKVSGFQFHPEKSGDEGIALLKSWLSR